MKTIKKFPQRVNEIFTAIAGKKEYMPADIARVLSVDESDEIVFECDHVVKGLMEGIDFRLVIPTVTRQAKLIAYTIPSEEHLDSGKIGGKVCNSIGKFKNPIVITVDRTKVHVKGVTSGSCPLLIEVINSLVVRKQLHYILSEILMMADAGDVTSDLWSRFLAENIDNRFDISLIKTSIDDDIMNDDIRLIIRDLVTKRLVIDTFEQDQSRYFTMNNWKDVMAIYNTWTALNAMLLRLADKWLLDNPDAVQTQNQEESPVDVEPIQVEEIIYEMDK